VTFLFTDIEGSTSLWERAPEAMRDALADHDVILRRVTAAHHGVVFKTIGDAFCCAFARSQDAAAAAIDAQRTLSAHAWPSGIGELRVRMGIHTGSTVERDGDYFGPTVNRVARLMSIGYGGQILVSAAAAALLESAKRPDWRLRDLGAHRLRDLSHAETTFQLETDGLRSEFPSLASLDARPNNLPSQISSFVGRDRELNELRTLLTEHRLVTVTGAGGIGKTRLALQVAAGVIDGYRDGAWFVDLSGLAQGELIAQTIAASLGIAESRLQPILDALIDGVAHKNLLLVIDNAEHVLAGVAAVVKSMLARAAETTVLVTSREALHLTGEAVYRLEPMPEPPAHLRAAELMQHESTRLLLERARSIVRDLIVTDEDAGEVAAVCRKLEGIPLAIELAAARVNTLSLKQLNARLSQPLPLLATRDSTLGRHRTLRSTIDWSYRLLDDDERTVLSALSIFADGFTLEACERVAPVTGVPVFDVLQSLTEKSFVQADTRADEPRFRQLEIVRAYARAELEKSTSLSEIARRHALYFAAFAGVGKELDPNALPHWYQRLDDELSNLRAALDWCVANDAALAAQLALDLAPYWRVRGTITEARGRLSPMLRRDFADGRLRAALLCVAASFATMQDDFTVSLALANEALALSRDSGDSRNTAEALFRIAEVEHRKGNLDEAEDLYEQARPLFVEAKNARGETMCIGNLGMLARQRGNYSAARTLLENAHARATVAGEHRIAGDFVLQLAWVNVYLQDFASASRLFEIALAQKKSESDLYGVCRTLHGLGTVMLKRGELSEAFDLFKTTIEEAIALGLHDYLFRGFDGISAVLALSARLPEAVQYLRLADRLFDTSGRKLRDSVAFEVASGAIDVRASADVRKALLPHSFVMTVEEAVRALPDLRSKITAQ